MWNTELKKNSNNGEQIRVLMIAPTPFFSDRGCHVRIYEEVKALQQNGCEVIVATYHIGRDMDGVSIERISNIPWYKKVSAGPSWQKPFLDILLLLKAFSIAREFKPHIIHAHLHEGAFIGAFVSKWFRVPLIFDYQGSMTGEMLDHRFLKKNGIIFKLFKELERWIDKVSDLILPSSTGAADVLKSTFGIASKKVIPLLDAVDTGIFQPGYNVTDLRKKLDIPEGRRVIAYLGVLNEYQGLDLLLTAAKDVISQIKEAHFLIMGYPNVERYRDMAESLGISANISFTGRLNYSEAPMYLCMGEIAVSAKLSKTEANGKISNYMAAGLPTVCFDTNVNREILGDCGVYAEFGDKDALSAAILKLLSNPARIKALKKAVRKRAETELSWRAAGEKMMNIYGKIL